MTDEEHNLAAQMVTDEELLAIERDARFFDTPLANRTRRAIAEVRRLKAERAELRRLAKAVRDYWRENPGHTKDGISVPGMVLLMAVER